MSPTEAVAYGLVDKLLDKRVANSDTRRRRKIPGRRRGCRRQLRAGSQFSTNPV